MEASEASAKKKMNIGGLDLFFKKETDYHKASCDLVLKHHDIRVPLGFKYLREEVKIALEQLDLCITTGDWETTKIHQK